jgi:hypothetical protein
LTVIGLILPSFLALTGARTPFAFKMELLLSLAQIQNNNCSKSWQHLFKYSVRLLVFHNRMRVHRFFAPKLDRVMIPRVAKK